MPSPCGLKYRQVNTGHVTRHISTGCKSEADGVVRIHEAAGASPATQTHAGQPIWRASITALRPVFGPFENGYLWFESMARYCDVAQLAEALHIIFGSSSGFGPFEDGYRLSNEGMSVRIRPSQLPACSTMVSVLAR